MKYPSRIFSDLVFKKFIKTLNFQHVLTSKKWVKSFSQDSRASIWSSHNLYNRSIVRITGADSDAFLQSLLTNDVYALSRKNNCLYAMMLNLKGRVLVDLILYLQSSSCQDKEYLIECDKLCVEDFIKSIKKYKIRKKVNISKVDDLEPHVLLPPKCLSENPIIPNTKNSANFTFYADPRLKDLGYRLILPKGIKVSKMIENVEDVNNIQNYTSYRYELGVGEGFIDHPPQICLPLECNIVFLNGVCFKKGCYIGQELTARTHHTGVIRKRIMPLTLDREIEQPSSIVKLENKNGKSMGKFRNSVGIHGLALLRVGDVSNNETILLKDSNDNCLAEANAKLPTWWLSNEN